MAITGHTTSKEIVRYTKGAEQRLLARNVFDEGHQPFAIVSHRGQTKLPAGHSTTMKILKSLKNFSKWCPGATLISSCKSTGLGKWGQSKTPAFLRSLILMCPTIFGAGPLPNRGIELAPHPLRRVYFSGLLRILRAGGIVISIIYNRAERMPTPPVSDEDLRATVAAYAAAGRNQTATAQALGLARETVQKLAKNPKNLSLSWHQDWRR